MMRVTSTNSPYSFLQQRLMYMDQYPKRSFTEIIENVPQWPYPLPELTYSSLSVERYAPCHGNGELIEAICAQESRKHDASIQPENVLVTNGAMQALSLIFRSQYRPGAVALCQYPVLGQVSQQLAQAGYRVCPFSTAAGEANPEQIRYSCKLSDVRLIFINSPHNPTGDICSEQTLRRLIRLAEQSEAVLVADMVYADFIFSEVKAYSPLACRNDWRRLFVINSMSKSYGAPGLRIGWIISDANNIAKLAGQLEQECLAVCGVAQQNAHQLLGHGNTALIESVVSRKKSVEPLLSKWRNIRYCKPLGGTQFLVELPVADIEAFADYMLVTEGLLLATSSNYVGLTTSCLRLPIGRPVSLIESALETLAEGLRDFLMIEHKNRSSTKHHLNGHTIREERTYANY
jgi:beta-methylarginine biosynthesis bifunctional aminotransferase